MGCAELGLYSIWDQVRTGVSDGCRQAADGVLGYIDSLPEQISYWKGRAIVVLSEAAKGLSQLVDSVCGLTYAAQAVVMSWNIVASLQDRDAGKNGIIDGINEFRSFSDATRLPNSIRYFSTDDLSIDIAEGRFFKVVSSVVAIPLRVFSLFSWLKDRGVQFFKQVSDSCGSLRLFGQTTLLSSLPVIESLSVLASGLSVLDRGQMILKGNNIAYHVCDGASSLFDIAQTTATIAAEQYPVIAASFGLVSAFFGLAAFFLDPDLK